MKLNHALLPVVAALTLFEAANCHTSPYSSKAADELAWRTLAGISRPTESTGAQKADTPFSWRLWWTAADVYTSTPPDDPAHRQDIAGVFRQFECGYESERTRFVPAPVSTDAQCEIVWINGASAGYVFAHRLWKRQEVIAAAAAKRINFPESPGPIAVEMKTEWRPITDPQISTYVTAVDSVHSTRGLVAFHMMIHARPNWVWATFIHEDFAALLAQADEKAQDGFGDHNGQPSDELKKLLAEQRVEVLSHYKLIGTQIDFEKPLTLGNPMIEPINAIKEKHVSCITCHAFAAVDGRGQIPSQPPSPGLPRVPTVFNSVNFNFAMAQRAPCAPAGPSCSPQ